MDNQNIHTGTTPKKVKDILKFSRCFVLVLEMTLILVFKSTFLCSVDSRDRVLKNT